MMVVHSQLTTPMELYWFVWTMSMVLCVMTGGDPLDATVVCTQLGFSPTGLFYHLWIIPLVSYTSFLLTGSLPVVRSGLGSPPNRSIFLDNVVCTGGEGNLTECGYTTISNCDSSEEAGVRCEGW